MTSSIVVTLLILNIISSTFAKCPLGCSCSEKSVICTCEDSLGGDSGTQLTLPPLDGLHFLHTLIVHTCDTLIIRNDTFNGIVFQQLIKLIAIRKVVIESWAFRGVLRSPRELIIQEANLQRIPTNAFTGLSNLKHIWFRNCTITSIAANAFEYLSNVEYIYFRDSTIVQLDNFAFSKMHDVENFFIRGNVHIRSLGSFIFAETQIHQLIIEDVRMSGSELSLVGINAHSVHIMHSRWRNKRFREALRLPPQSIGHLQITNSTIDRLVLATFFNTTNIQLHGNQIGEFASTSNARLRNVRRIEITKSTIKQWNANMLHNANRIKVFEVFDSHVGTIAERALRNAHIERMNFKKTEIGRVGSAAFERSTFGSLMWTECQIDAMSPNAFSNMATQMMVITNTKLTLIASNCFADMAANSFVIFNAKIAQIGSSPFANAEVNNLTIRNCELTSGHFNTLFMRLKASSLTVIENVFGCAVNDCETNALLLSSGQRRMPWHFEHNSCLHQNSNICMREREFTVGNVHCRARREIVECVCVDDTSTLVMPTTNATMMLIGDCSHLHLNAVPTSSIVSLHLYRAETLELERLPPLLNTLQIFHSNIEKIAESAFANLNVERVELIATRITTIQRHAFRGSNIRSFILRDSTIAEVERAAFGGSNTEHFFAESCKFYRVNNMWSHFNNVSVSESFITDARALLHVKAFCFRDSMTACVCVPEEFTEKNICESKIATCSGGSEMWNKVSCLESSEHYSNGANLFIIVNIPMMIFESPVIIIFLFHLLRGEMTMRLVL